ncbi:hypothetical protein VIRA109638_05750 [Vibrio rarus]
MPNQGDLCPFCGLIIVFPPAIDPICMGCGEDVTDESDED